MSRTIDPQSCLIDLSVVIPAYNEAERIERALERVTQFLEERGAPFEVIVADDGSTDATTLIVQRFIAARRDSNVRLVQLPVNRGKGAALRAGVAASTGTRVLLMDADLATPMEELDVLARALDQGMPIATGSRAVRTSSIRRPQSILRVLLGRAGNLWIRTLAVPGIHDTQCGFKLFQGDVGRELFRLSSENRFGIDIEILCIARRHLGMNVAEVGVAWEHQEGSKVRWRDYVDVFLKVPRIVWTARRLSRRR